jgi:LPPG:FO 2-phospho-L-lactate transferase
MGTIAALAGGVGAARFLRGLVRAMPATNVVVVGNTGDDAVFHGLHVSPDLDTVTYTLAGAVGAAGWGLAGDTFRTLEAYDRYGEATWFRLGDADLATHLYRTSRLREGATLTEVTAEITLAWDVKAKLLPMSDDRVATVIDVAASPDSGPGGGPPVTMAMQEWFVRERAQPPVAGVRFEGAAEARPGPAVLDALREADAILLCPSNPVISIGPILALPGVREALRARRGQVVGVSPIIRGATVKGPADRLMAAAGIEVSCAGVASIYADICGTLLVDDSDADRVGDVEAHGVRAAVAPILMRDADAATELARRALELVA